MNWAFGVVGSQSVHLVVGVGSGDDARAVHDRKIGDVRLVNHLGDTGVLPSASMIALGNAVREAAQEAFEHEAEHIDFYATSPLREAVNGTSAIEVVRDLTGHAITVLEGHEEATYSFYGARQEFQDWLTDARGVARELIVVDLGGGSLEIARGTDTPERLLSLHAGTGRGGTDLTGLLEAIGPASLDKTGADGTSPVQAPLVVGNSRTVRVLAGWGSPKSAGKGAVLSLELIEAFLTADLDHRMSGMPTDVSPDRAAQLEPGARTLKGLLEELQIEELTVGTSGVREGLMLKRPEGRYQDKAAKFTPKTLAEIIRRPPTRESLRGVRTAPERA